MDLTFGSLIKKRLRLGGVKGRGGWGQGGFQKYSKLN